MSLISKVKERRKERALIIMLSIFFLIIIIFFSSLLVKTNREYQHFQLRIARTEAKLNQAQKEFQQKEIYMSRLLEDPEFLERVVRDRLSYSRPDEVIFKFTNDP
ncbi:MAG: septum formation initiator family protein [Puniceicoccaceae bacterium]|nr:septum formation initiator family protein [Puniceicoccaceae bacterium]